MLRLLLCFLSLWVILLVQSASTAPSDEHRREKRTTSIIYDTWAGHYNNIIKDYIEDVYPDVIETFLGATIKMLGWAAFGTFLVLKGSWLNAPQTATGYRGFEARSLTEDFGGYTTEDATGKMNFTMPYLGDLLGVDLTFPVDNSLQECFGGRESCVNRNFPGEVDHLIENFSKVKGLFGDWWGMAGKIRTMVEDGDDYLYVDEEE